jgi:hypothetical protein
MLSHAPVPTRASRCEEAAVFAGRPCPWHAHLYPVEILFGMHYAEEGSKVDRMAAQSAKIEAGHVYLPKSAAWLGEFLTELLSFPNGRHDDQVDSVSQFLGWLQDAYLNQISFHVPFVVSRPREFLPP